MSRHRGKRAESVLSQRLDALNSARELAAGRLGEQSLSHAYDVLEQATSRRSLSADHTVVGFFGSTGSGKSSLFNAVTETSMAKVAARRPTTDQALAAVWGEPGSEGLLDWLEVDSRHVGPADSALAKDGGLILLDLPDFDSINQSNKAIVERLVGQVDVLLWVMDPQKYADAAVHHGFLAKLSAHDAVTLVVLNQIDTLADAQLNPVIESLKGLLAAEQLGRVPVLAASAQTGDGVDKVRAAITKVVASRKAAQQRLSADVTTAARALLADSGEGAPAGIHAGDKRQLIDRLCAAANVDVVVDAVRQSYLLDSAKATGWPVTRWLARFRRDPLRRLSLRRSDPSTLNRTSLPDAGPAQQAAMDSAVRTFADAVSAGAPGLWRSSIRAQTRSRQGELAQALDQAVAGTDLQSNRRPWWWGVFNAVQWLALLTAVGGLGWLGVLAVLGYLQLPVPVVPKVAGWPVPTVVVLLGLLLGIVLAVLSRIISGVGAGGRRKRVRRRLRASVGALADTYVIGPAEAELERYADFRAAVGRAAAD